MSVCISSLVFQLQYFSTQRAVQDLFPLDSVVQSQELPDTTQEQFLFLSDPKSSTEVSKKRIIIFSSPNTS